MKPYFLKHYNISEEDLIRFYYDIICKKITNKPALRDIKSALFSEYLPEEYPNVCVLIYNDTRDWHVEYVYAKEMPCFQNELKEAKEIIKDCIPIIEAFCDIMDGTKENELQSMTGFSEERCKEIYQIYKNCTEKK
jgi:hypothetical protein